MLKIISPLLVVAATLSLSTPAKATPPSANFSVFYIENTLNSGLANSTFCVSIAHDVLLQNGFTNVGTDSAEAWGDLGDTFVVVGCVPYGANSRWAGAHIVAAGPDYATTENWRNLIRLQMQDFFVTL
jgi:hypothetical protein